MSGAVSRGARLADIGAVALVVAGAATYLHARARLAGIADGSIRGAPGEWLMPVTERYANLASWGLGLVVAGIVAGIASHLYHRRDRTRGA